MASPMEAAILIAQAVKHAPHAHLALTGATRPVQYHSHKSVNGHGGQEYHTALETHKVDPNYKFTCKVAEDPVVQKVDWPEGECDGKEEVRGGKTGQTSW